MTLGTVTQLPTILTEDLNLETRTERQRATERVPTTSGGEETSKRTSDPSGKGSRYGNLQNE